MAMAASSLSQMPDNVLADTYIGSLVSLTTKNNIRYEGFVFRIDTQTRSIFLRNVKTFGTEGRTTNGPHVPPSNIIMDCLIFQSNHLKDVRVISLANAQDPPDLPDDPAIIHTRPPFPPSTLRLVTPDTFQTTNVVLPMEASRRTYVSFSPVPQFIPSSVLPPGFSSLNSSTQQQPRQQPSILTAPYSGPLSNHRPINISSFEPYYDSAQSLSNVQSSHEPIANAKEGTQKAGEAKMLPERQNIKVDEAASSSRYCNRLHNERQVKGVIFRDQNTILYADKGKPQAYQSHKGHGQSETRRNAVSQPVTMFAEDFDFEAMNQKFNKAEIWDTLSKNNPKSDHLPVYQMDDHFFDSISRDTQQQNISSSEMDKLNAETFGIQNPQRDRVLTSHGHGRSSQDSYRGKTH